MKSVNILAACGVIVIILCLTGEIVGQGNTDVERAVVVRLHMHFSTQKKDETAAGLLVGKDPQYAYFITARHAVVDEVGNQELHSESTELWFYDRNQSVKAQVFAHTDALLDLGVVYVPVTELPINLPQIVRKGVAVNASVVIVGHPAAGDWSFWPGKIQNENAPNGDVHHFVTTTDPSLAHGYSGGPVFDSEGYLIGMHVATEASYGIAAKAADIAAQLEAWRIPRNNVTDQSDRDAIKDILGLYEAAYSHRDASALWAIWPTAPLKTRQATLDYFGKVVAIERTLRQLDFKIDPSGRTATVKGYVSDLIIPKNGVQQALKDTGIIFLLNKTEGKWSISEIH
jgi:trypsin-like peptidase